MPSPADTASTVRIAAPSDDLCLRFANTRYWRGRAEPIEDLPQATDLLRWVEAEAGLPSQAVKEIATAWELRRETRQGFADALRLREVLFRLFAAMARGEPGARTDVTELNQALGEAPLRTCVALDPPAGWLVPHLAPRASALLTPVLWSAGDLALGPRAGRVRQCANPECQWLFLDDSKSGNRRWCSMSACGNRAKAHRHYLKQKGQRAAG